MSDDIAISVENLSKRYLIGHQTTGPETFREMLGRQTRRTVRNLADVARGRQLVRGDEVEEFWALRDVSFEVTRGEVLGVIGRNGAGKSTLLKLLSRITEPTEGRAVIRGRVSSLLEVGTGFHPELTGRENIFLNGSILGLSRAEIKARFDEIVDFAEVERFLDTPVKRYSSGMYVRLAFAVAAHLEPEILIIDEVLAVGDTAFQRKCLGKMQDVAEAGRTVLFVSHNLPMVIKLTTRTVLLEQGRLRANGASREIVAQFMKMTHQLAGAEGGVAAFRRPHRTEGYADIEGVRICGAQFGSATEALGSDIVFEVDLDLQRFIEDGIVNINIFNQQLEAVTTLASADSDYTFSGGPKKLTVRCNAGPLPLMPGEYRLSVGVAQKGGGLAWDVVESMPGFRIDGHNNTAWMSWPSRPGQVLFDNCDWSDRQYSRGDVIGETR